MLLTLALLLGTPLHASPTLTSNTSIATAGYFQLNWQAETASDFVLQQAQNPNFTQAHTLYEGLDRSTVISGLANGDYYYRVRTQGDDRWSSTLKVTVQHHSLGRALAFFTLGVSMFLVTLFVIIQGAKKESSL